MLVTPSDWSWPCDISRGKSAIKSDTDISNAPQTWRSSTCLSYAYKPILPTATVHKYKYKNTNTQVQLHRCKYSSTCLSSGYKPLLAPAVPRTHVPRCSVKPVKSSVYQKACRYPGIIGFHRQSAVKTVRSCKIRHHLTSTWTYYYSKLYKNFIKTI